MKTFLNIYFLLIALLNGTRFYKTNLMAEVVFLVRNPCFVSLF